MVENKEYEKQKAVRVNRARLLASAPEMLLLLEEVSEFLRGTYIGHIPTARGLADKAEALTKKAREG